MIEKVKKMANTLKQVLKIKKIVNKYIKVIKRKMEHTY